MRISKIKQVPPEPILNMPGPFQALDLLVLRRKETYPAVDGLNIIHIYTRAAMDDDPTAPGKRSCYL